MARLRLKRQLLDALADMTRFASPEGMVEQEFSQIWQRLEADRQAGRLDDDDKAKDEETLKQNTAPSRSAGFGWACCWQRSAG